MFITVKVEILKEIFGIIKKLTTEPTIKITENYWLLDLWTADNTTNVNIKLFKNNFTKYDFEKEVCIKFNANIFYEVLSKSSKDDTIFISFNEDYSLIKITITNDKRKKSYELRLLEINPEDIKELGKERNMEFTCKVISNPKNILEMLDSLIFVKQKKGNDSVTIKSTSETIEIIEEEISLGKSILTLKDFDYKGIKDTIRVRLSFGLLRPLLELSTKISEKSLFELKQDYPIRITSVTPECETICLLAPRVDTE